MAKRPAATRQKLATRQQRITKGQAKEPEIAEPTDRRIPRRDQTPITALNDTQKRYINAIKTFQLTFATGPAGTGKTWIAAALAAQAIENGNADKIIITRPAVEAGESLGFLPGEIDEKYAPYLAPVIGTFNERLGKSFTDYCLKTGKIEALPLAYTRGVTFRNAFVMLDEAQNTTPAQMKMFLTRIGENCTVVVNGDIEQKDIPGKSGFEDAIERCGHIPSVKLIRFDDQDIVRSGLVAEIIHAYRSPIH